MTTLQRLNEITQTIIGSAVAVHRELGPGLLESAYEACLAFELAARGLRVERQKPLPLVYRGLILDCVYRLDLVVEEAVVVEAKALDALLPVHHAQLISYLKIAGLPLGLLINFHCMTLTKGIRRVINGYPAAPSEPIAPSASSVLSVSSVVKGPST